MVVGLLLALALLLVAAAPKPELVLIQLLLMVGQLAVAQLVKLVTLKHVLIMVAQQTLAVRPLVTII